MEDELFEEVIDLPIVEEIKPITIKDIVLASEYFDKINCILPVLEQTGIYDYWSLQNAAGIIRGPICGIDIFQFVATLNKIYEDYDND